MEPCDELFGQIVVPSIDIPGGTIDIEFLGKNNIYNDPGRLPQDPDALKKIYESIPYSASPHVVFFSDSNHGGEIVRVDDSNDPRKSLLGGYCLGNIYHFPGDGVIARIKRQKPIKTSVFIRVRDCFGCVGVWYNDTDIFIFGIHISAGNEFGYGQNLPNGFRPIMRQLLSLIPRKKILTLKPGPSIAGLRREVIDDKPVILEGCKCYDYTQTKNRPDGTKLINSIIATHPGIENLWGDYYDQIFQEKNEKLIIYWGLLFWLVLTRHYKIPEDRVNFDHNEICTLCNEKYWYSARGRNKNPETANTPDLALGNLACITFSPTLAS